jgi:hypothetical protein
MMELVTSAGHLGSICWQSATNSCSESPILWLVSYIHLLSNVNLHDSQRHSRQCALCLCLFSMNSPWHKQETQLRRLVSRLVTRVRREEFALCNR